MLTKLFRLLTQSALAGLFAISANMVHAQEEQSYLLATASTGGTYYPVGVALATLTKVKLQPKEKIGMSAINSAGSGENVKLLREGEAQFAILQGLFGHYAATGTGPVEADGPQEHLRAVTMLWQNVEQFVVKNDHVKSGNVDDLAAMKGSAMALGKKNSGTIGSNKTLFSGLGIDIENDYELFYGGYGPSADALQNGQVEGMNTAAGVPTGAVTKAYAAIGDKITMLEVTDEQIATLDGGKGLWTRYVIEADTYPGQSEAINTVAQPNFLAVHADVPEETVYKITKTIFENLPFLQAIHKATNAMALEKALAGLPVPLHPGAAKYFQEAGVEVPENLIAQ